MTLPFLDDLVRRFEDSAAGQRAAQWHEAHGLAGHMLAQWPKHLRPREPSESARMLDLLTRLDDTALVERFLIEVTATGRHAPGDNDAVMAALARLPSGQRAALIERVVGGAAPIAFGACAGLLRRASSEWAEDRAARLTGAAGRLVDALPSGAQAAYDPWGPRSRVDDQCVADLLAGVGAIDAALAGRAVNHLLAHPKTFGMDAVLVPALRRLAGAGAPSAAAIQRLRAACLAHLRTRIAEPLAPASDWTRASALPCRCEDCLDLARFLAGPGCETWVFRAAAPRRRHLEETIKQAKCDLDVRTDEKGRPYSLACTKNQASYERRRQQREQDLEDAAQLA